MTTVEENDRQFPLSVFLTAMSGQTRAQIEYFIERDDNKLFSIAKAADDADVVMIDFEHGGTTSLLEAGEWDDSDKTLVILTGSARQIHGAIMVAKPIDGAKLEDAAAIALQKLNGHLIEADQDRDTRDNVNIAAEDISATGDDKKAVQPPPKLTRKTGDSRPDDTDTPTYFRTIDAALPSPPTLSMMMRIQRYQDKIDLLCGPPRTLEQLSDPFNTDHRYDPLRCLSRRVSNVVFNSDPDIKAVHIKLPEAEIYVLPTLNKVYTSVSLEYKRNVERLFKHWDDVDVKVFEYDNNNVNEVIDTLNQSTRYSFSSQSFCWLSSLFSAQGRLPLGQSIDSVSSLLHWPNITRLELIPDSLEISAAWTGKIASLPQIINMVRCEPRHAVSFMNAASTINLLVDANGNKL